GDALRIADAAAEVHLRRGLRRAGLRALHGLPPLARDPGHAPMSEERDDRIASLFRRLDLAPTDAAPARALAEELEASGQYADAVRARRIAAERCPDRPLDQLHLARALVRAGGE